jgi:hypothetical protein
MKETIIAVIKRKDGFIKEMFIPRIEPYMETVDVPPLRTQPDIADLTSAIERIVRRHFKPVNKKTIVEYEEV